ncbi:GNAT family N-acetyltransferase [Rhizomonospora bruguierae]|uniref:GNAT family N-acetyltransferase n=1 Tax=Rhizomonospora bruguierae TaxID=1581705 RepID=UPI001BCC69AC|nr:GNAT family N-acetyltransferase [Micromonospora sp. NBRC 107566]
MLGQHDVGHRVVVRRFVRLGPEGRPLFGDLIGELLEFGEETLRLRTRDGATHRVARGDIIGAKRVPPWRPPNRRVAALERAAEEAWPAPVREALGEWVLRCAEGWTGRGNSALAVGDPGLPLPAAVDAVENWYAARGRPPMINLPLPLAAPVAAELDARGWRSRPPTLVQTAAVKHLVAAAPGEGVELAATPTPGWLRSVAGRTGTLPPAAHHILAAVERVRFAHVYGDGGDLLGTARGTVTGGGRWLGLFLIDVRPEARRRGVARHLIGALAQWAAGEGAIEAFLQVEEHNEPAKALYRDLGFTTHHTYVTRIAPG